jgi:hypothetical protein
MRREGRSAGQALTCEFFVGDELYEGEARDLDLTGFFVETDVAIEPDSEVELKLTGQPGSAPAYLRAKVERSVVSSALAPDGVNGIQLRILQMCHEYAALIGASGTSTQAGPSSSAGRGLPVSRSRSSENEWAQALDSDLPSSKRPSSGHGIDGSRWGNQVPLFERAGEPLWSETPPAPNTMVIDDGELSDFVAILEGMGAAPCRQNAEDTSALAHWVPPQQLLVVNAELAMSLRLPLGLMPQGAVAIAVTDANSRSLSSSMHRLGYRYVVRRPVHLLALRMLLRKVLENDAGRRSAPREAFGGEVRWRQGLRRGRGTIVDLSSHGCLLLAEERAQIGSRLKIRVPAQGREIPAFSMRGRVIRCTEAGGGQVLLGLEANLGSWRANKRIQQMLGALASGPVRLPQESFVEDPAGERSHKKAYDIEKEHRRFGRAAFSGEVLALESQADVVRFVLVGRDLSEDGIRVEPHPLLELDERLRLALYDVAGKEPLTLQAAVARDDGRLGCWLRFAELERDDRQRVVRAILALPSLERVDEEKPEAAWIVMGQVDSREA